MRIRSTVSLPHSSQTLLVTTMRFLVVSQNLSNNKHLMEFPERSGKLIATSGQAKLTKLINCSSHKRILGWLVSNSGDGHL
jgi:hypothetical protein